MKFRIKHIEGIGYFSQVEVETKVFGRVIFRTWYRIGRHPTGFGLYSETSITYPLRSLDDADSLCWDYREWEGKVNKGTVTYIWAS